MTSIPLKILTIDEINNKSITVTIDGDFLGTEDFLVYKLVDETQTVDIEAVEDSIDPEPNKKVIVTKGLDLFEKGTVYVLKIIRENEEVQKDFTVTSYKPPNIAFVRPFGDRIIKIEFTTPIRNLNAQDRVRDENGNPIEDYLELRNFYFLYDSLNISGSDSADNQWLGLIRYAKYEDEETIIDRIKPNCVRVAPDFKSIEIQYNEKSIVTGKNRVIIHYSNNQQRRIRKGKDMTDFADPPRLVPVMTLGFDIKKSDHVGEAIECQVLSRTELIVTYNEPVILLQTYRRGHLYINGRAAVAKYVRRVGNEFNKIKFVLEANSALPMNFADIKIDAIVDANGYITGEKEFLKVPVISIAPKIKSLVQVDPPNEESTAMIALWSKDMKYFDGNPNMVGVVDNISNYKLLDFNNNEISVLEISYNKDTKELKIVTSKLDSGLYILQAKNVEDELGEKMIPQEIQINIEDRTIPKVIEVVYRNDVNSFVVKFDDIMSSIGEHSALEESNYLIEYKADVNNTITNVLPSQTRTFGFNNNKWIRFTMPEEIKLIPPDIPSPLPPIVPVDDRYSLHIGYPMVKRIKYVEDASKNIYPLCNVKNFKQYEMIDIVKGEKRVIADNKLIFTYTGHNQIYSVSLGDFDFSINGGSLKTAINAELKNWKTIEFTFPQNTFDGNVTDIEIKTVANPVSTDIFGAPFKGDAVNNILSSNGLSPKIKAISLVSKDDNGGFKATLRFVFSKFMRIFHKEDIKITLNNSDIPLIIQGNPIGLTAQPNDPALVYDVVVNLPYSISLNDVFMVSLANSNYIQSKDISGNPLSVFQPILVDKFIASNFYWGYESNRVTLDKNFFQIVYNKPVNPSSFINQWDGSARPIAIGNIVFDKELSSNEFTMIINTDVKNFGMIKFYPNSEPLQFLELDPTTPTGYKTTLNTQIAIITLTEGNKLTVKFSDLDSAKVNPNAVAFAEYIGIKDVNNSEDTNYLYEGYRPTHVF